MKLAIVGPSGSGKDEVARYLARTTPLRFARSASEVIARMVAAEDGISVAHAMAKRHAEWRRWQRLGDLMRRDDPAKLARATLADGEICVGIRNRREIVAVRDERLVELVLWIDRPVAEDPTLEFGVEMADVIIPNWWGLGEFHERLNRLASSLGLPASGGPQNGYPPDGWLENARRVGAV